MKTKITRFYYFPDMEKTTLNFHDIDDLDISKMFLLSNGYVKIVHNGTTKFVPPHRVDIVYA